MIGLLFVLIFSTKVQSSIFWFCAGLFVSLIFYRYSFIFELKRDQSDIINYEKLEKHYAYVTASIGFCWALLIFFGLSINDAAYHLFSILFLIGLISVASLFYHASLKSLYFFIVPMTLLCIPMIVLKVDNGPIIGVCIFLYAVLMLKSGTMLNQMIVVNLSQRYEAEDYAKRMQSLMDYAPAAIYVKDLNGHFSFMNQKVADLHNMPRDALMGKTLHDILPKDIADSIRKNDKDVIREQTPRQYEEDAPQSDGLHHYISMKFPLFDDKGDIYAIGGVSTDITQRVQIEESLRISQQRLLLHRDQSPVGVIEWNTDFTFIDWNPAAEKIFGFTKEEVVGAHITERILSESVRPVVDKIWEDLLANKGGTHSINENITKDGRTILCEWHNTPLIDHTGTVIGVTSLVDDITERKRLENEQKTHMKHVHMGEMISMIAHQWRQPLSALTSTSSTLQLKIALEHYDKEYFQERLKAMDSYALYLSRTIDDFRNLFRSNKSEALFRVSDMLENALALSETLFKSNKVIIEKNFDNDIEIMSFETELIQVLLNIFANAVDALIEEKVENPKLIVMLYKSEDKTVLSVEDNAGGVPTEIFIKMFEPYFSTKSQNGTGLGLYMSKVIIEDLCSGSLLFENTDAGAKFIVIL